MTIRRISWCSESSWCNRFVSLSLSFLLLFSSSNSIRCVTAPQEDFQKWQLDEIGPDVAVMRCKVLAGPVEFSGLVLGAWFALFDVVNDVLTLHRKSEPVCACAASACIVPNDYGHVVRSLYCAVGMLVLRAFLSKYMFDIECPFLNTRHKVQYRPSFVPRVEMGLVRCAAMCDATASWVRLPKSRAARDLDSLRSLRGAATTR